MSFVINYLLCARGLFILQSDDVCGVVTSSTSLSNKHMHWRHKINRLTA